MNTKKRNPVAVLLGLAADSRGKFVESVIFAILGVVAGVVPYFMGAEMIVALMGGNRDLPYFGRLCIIALLAYLLKLMEDILKEFDLYEFRKRHPCPFQEGRSSVWRLPAQQPVKEIIFSLMNQPVDLIIFI